MGAKKLIQFDWAMKTLLRREENFPILEGLLSELLKTDVKIESLLESESNKRFSDDKSNRVDIFALLSNEEKVIIELQVDREWDFLARMLYGTSKVIVEHLKEGDLYGMIPRVISVNIVYFDLGHGEDYIYHGTTHFKGIHRKDELQLTDKERKQYPSHVTSIENIFPEYYILKVGRFDLNVKDTLDEWMYALKESEVKPEFKAKGIHEAGKKLAILSLSDQERARYDRYIEELRISRSTLETSFSDGVLKGMEEGEAQGLEKGLQKGRAEGRAEGEALGLAKGEMKAKMEMVRNLHQLGISIEQIASAAKLSCQEVKTILGIEA